MDNQISKKRVRCDSNDSDLDSLEVKRLRDDLLDLLDESDPDPATQDLDSVMKSFAEEISPVSSPPVRTAGVSSESGESESVPELGYLLFASDDELGLPPSDVSTSQADRSDGNELVRVASDSSGIEEIWEFEDPIPSYDSFEIGAVDRYYNETEYAAFDGLFEHSDVYSVFS